MRDAARELVSVARDLTEASSGRVGVRYQKVSLSKLIESLKSQQRAGGRTVLIDGTLLVPETGNSVVLTNRPQM